MELKVIKTKHGLFFISNPNETIQKHLISHGEFEYPLVHFASSVLNIKPGIVIDVGANIGTFSIPLAINYPNCEFIAFEPQRTVYHHLVSNVFVNQLLNITLNRNAIGDCEYKQLKVPFFDISENYTGSVSLDQNVINKRSQIRGIAEPGIYAKNYDFVNVMQLDEVISSNVSVIKIDVEGMELSVLKSARRILENNSPIVLFETWDLPEFTQENKAIYKFLSSIGYTSFKVGNDSIACKKEDSNLIKLIGESGLEISQKI